MMIIKCRFKFISLLAVILTLGFLLSEPSFAAEPTGTETCTDNPAFDPSASGTPGLVSTVVSQVQSTMSSMAQKMFTTIESSGSFQEAVSAVIILYIAIYGIFFTVGMARESVYDFAIRVVKLTLVGLLATGGAWSVFDSNVVQLFNTTVDELINEVTSVAVGGASATPGPPLAVLDEVINKAFSAKMLVHLAAMAETGMYGIMHAALSGLALMSLAGSFLLAIWIYLMSLVMRTLLFGLAPIFLACMLFNRTKPIFLGWVNQLVSVCLQPIFLFIFLTFFLQLISGTIDQLLAMPVCWTEVSDTMRGTPFQYLLPRFAIPDPSNPTKWIQYDGDWFWDGPGVLGAILSAIFPVDILAILTFYILTQVAGRFSEISVTVAKDIASGASNLLSMQSGFSDFFSADGSSSNASKVADRVGPTGRQGPVPEEEVAAANQTVQSARRDAAGVVDQIKNLSGNTNT